MRVEKFRDVQGARFGRRAVARIARPGRIVKTKRLRWKVFQRGQVVLLR